MPLILSAALGLFTTATSFAAHPLQQLYRNGPVQISEIRVNLPQFSVDRQNYFYHLSRALEATQDIDWYQRSKYGLILREVVAALWPQRSHWSGVRQEQFAKYAFQLFSSHGNFSASSDEQIVLEGFSKRQLRYEIRKAISKGTLQLPAGANERQLIQTIVEEMLVRDPLKSRNSSAALAKGESNDIIVESNSNFFGPGFSWLDWQQTPSAARQDFLSSFWVYKGKLMQHRWLGPDSVFAPEIQKAIRHIRDAMPYAREDERKVLEQFIQSFQSGKYEDYLTAMTEWTRLNTEMRFLMHFIETMDDPLQQRGTFEGWIVVRTPDSIERIERIRKFAGMFEQRMPVDSKYKKPADAEAPSADFVHFLYGGASAALTPFLGKILPNEKKVTDLVGTMSITNSNFLTSDEEQRQDAPFVHPSLRPALMQLSSQLAEEILTQFHEIYGHGSGRTYGDANQLGNLFAPLEEGRAEIASLYHLTDPDLRTTGIVPIKDPAELDLFVKLAIATFFREHVRSYHRLSEQAVEIHQPHAKARQMMLNWLLRHDALQFDLFEGFPLFYVRDLAQFRTVLGRLWWQVQEIVSEADAQKGQALLDRWARYDDSHRAFRKAFVESKVGRPALLHATILNPRLSLIGGRVSVEPRPQDGTYGMDQFIEEEITAFQKRAQLRLGPRLQTAWAAGVQNLSGRQLTRMFRCQDL